MIVQKLRLQHGWSQQQLAEMSGLSTRTIQRIENGKTPSIESVKSLASVFEVDFSTLNGALTMNRDTLASQNGERVVLSLTREEQIAYQKVRDLKRFYVGLAIFLVVLPILLVINLVITPETWWVQWVFFGWGAGLVLRALKTFDWLPPLGAEWEKRQLNKFLDKK